MIKISPKSCSNRHTQAKWYKVENSRWPAHCSCLWWKNARWEPHICSCAEQSSLQNEKRQIWHNTITACDARRTKTCPHGSLHIEPLRSLATCRWSTHSKVSIHSCLIFYSFFNCLAFFVDFFEMKVYAFLCKILSKILLLELIIFFSNKFCYKIKNGLTYFLPK